MEQDFLTVKSQLTHNSKINKHFCLFVLKLCCVVETKSMKIISQLVAGSYSHFTFLCVTSLRL